MIFVSLINLGRLGGAVLCVCASVAFAQESLTPADFYVPMSARFEADSAIPIRVAGMEDVTTIEDVLALRDRVAGVEFSRDDVLSWRILGALGLSKIEREDSAPPPLPPGVVAAGPVRRLPDWRDTFTDIDPERYAKRSSCPGHRMLRIETPQASVRVSFGFEGAITQVNHDPAGSGMNERRFDIDAALLRSAKRFEGEWEIVREDTRGTLFKRSLAPGTDGRTMQVDTYVLADVASDEIRVYAIIVRDRLLRFDLALQALPAETSPRCVVPEIVLRFDRSTKNWTLQAHRFEKVVLDQEPPEGAFSYPLQKGDAYFGAVEGISRGGGVDIGSLTPDEAAALLKTAK